MPNVDPETIDEKVNRVEEIIEQLEAGDVSLGDTKALRDEGQQLLEELERDLDVGDGEIIEQ
jgi:exodeoxyribonuclease VII small subunit